MSWVDIAVCDFLFTVRERYDQNILGSFPELQLLSNKVNQQPQLRDYLENRGIPQF